MRKTVLFTVAVIAGILRFTGGDSPGLAAGCFDCANIPGSCDQDCVPGPHDKCWWGVWDGCWLCSWQGTGQCVPTDEEDMAMSVSVAGTSTLGDALVLEGRKIVESCNGLVRTHMNVRDSEVPTMTRITI